MVAEMRDQPTLDPSSRRLGYAALALGGLLWLGCVPDGGGGPTEADITGSVRGETFTVESGAAEFTADTYTVTLASTPEFSCSATSGVPSNYLLIDIVDIDEPGSYDAAGRVSFNEFVDGVSETEPAESGTVTIDAIDTFSGVIEGAVDATGPSSSVSGSFSVEICP